MAAVVLAGSLGLAVGSTSAHATVNATIEACYRTANDIFAAENGMCEGGFEQVTLAASTYSGSLPVCVEAGEPLRWPGPCHEEDQEFLYLLEDHQNGLIACSQERRTYHAPKPGGSCRPGREIVYLQTAGQGG